MEGTNETNREEMGERNEKNGCEIERNNETKADGKVIIISAPSGAGKTTIMKSILDRFPQLEFSVSATSRAPRYNEQDGVDYYFMSDREFMELVGQGRFVEWEQVYTGVKHGTLRSEVERIWGAGHVIIFDVEVKGAAILKEFFGSRAISIFIMPPSIDELRARLEKRGTESAEAIERRVTRATLEIEEAENYDKIVVNDSLPEAIEQVEMAIAEFITQHK